MTESVNTVSKKTGCIKKIIDNNLQAIEIFINKSLTV